jgi:hypothetical protein
MPRRVPIHNGPNPNPLGRREPEVYDRTTTPAELTRPAFGALRAPSRTRSVTGGRRAPASVAT